MGASCCKPDHRIPSDIPIKKDEEVVRFFMTGMASAGKSTIIRHLKYLCGKHREYKYCNDDWTERENDNEDNLMRKAIWENIINAMDVFIKQARINGKNFGNDEIEAFAKSVEHLYENKDEIPNVEMSDLFRENFVQLLQDPAIVYAIQKRNIIVNSQPDREIFDGMDYFMTPDKIKEVFSDSYTPTNDDKVHCRLPTTDLHRYFFQINKIKIEIYDAGGQVSIRRNLPELLKHWQTNNHYSKSREFIFFVTSIADFNVLHEIHRDSTLLQESEAYMESLLRAGQIQHCGESEAYMESLLRAGQIQHCGVLVFFNKKDRFINKLDDPDCRDDVQFLQKYLSSQDVKKYQETGKYDKKTMYEAAQRPFVDALKQFSDRSCYYRTTCAVDPEIMETFFGVVKHEILIENFHNVIP
uniref:Uncharacterized protein n=1 Tax=Panagrolaimus sp. JU765 TaxID=591449 RepID=A0AC34R678_9BILA